MDSPKRKNRQAKCIDGLLRNDLRVHLKNGGGCSPNLFYDLQASGLNGLSDFPVVYGAYELLYPKFWGLQLPLHKFFKNLFSSLSSL
ncbi:hypothetical protein AOC10_02345 [Polynucleobacter asymbioticus]|nr:hypothetical protein AOC10_02345 [Polynucleobacter asymbioticus]